MALDPLRSNTARTFIPSGTGIVGTKSHSLSSRDVRSNGTVNANASPAASPEDSLRSKQPPIAVTTVFDTIVDRSSLRCLVRSSGVTACISPGVEDEPARRSRSKHAVNVTSIHSGTSDSSVRATSAVGWMTGAISIFRIAPHTALSLTHGGAPRARIASIPPDARTTAG